MDGLIMGWFAATIFVNGLAWIIALPVGFIIAFGPVIFFLITNRNYDIYDIHPNAYQRIVRKFEQFIANHVNKRH